MIRIIGDRTGKSALDDMMEVSRQRNAEVAEEERLEAIRKQNPKTIKVSARNKRIITQPYNNLEWELEVPGEKDEEGYKKKQLFTYDKSLERLRAAGYERHPTPSEAFSLIADSLEGKLSGDLKAVTDEMKSDYGEWLSMAVEIKEEILICYLHPEGLIWNSKKGIYEKEGFKYDSKQEFSIRGKKLGKWIPLKEFGPSFVKLFYGRSFKDLPKVIREDYNQADVILPQDSDLWPVGRIYFSIFVDRFNIGSELHYRDNASRGVRARGSQ